MKMGLLSGATICLGHVPIVQQKKRKTFEDGLGLGDIGEEVSEGRLPTFFVGCAPTAMCFWKCNDMPLRHTALSRAAVLQELGLPNDWEDAIALGMGRVSRCPPPNPPQPLPFLHTQARVKIRLD